MVAASRAVDLSVLLDVENTTARCVSETSTIVGIVETSCLRVNAVVVLAATINEVPTSSRTRKLTAVELDPIVSVAPASAATVTEPLLGTFK